MGTEHPLVCSNCGEPAEPYRTRGEDQLCPSCVRKRDQERGRSLLERIRQKNRESFDAEQADRGQGGDP